MANFNGNNKHNIIDGLKTNQEIERFVNQVYLDELGWGKADFKICNYNEIEFWGLNDLNTFCQEKADSLEVKLVSKGDIDNNGLTDIMVIGKNEGPGYSGKLKILIIYCTSNFKYKIEMLSNGMAAFPILKKDNENVFIDYYYPYTTPKIIHPQKETLIHEIKRKKLIYKHGGIIEYRDEKSNYKINYIEYKSISIAGSTFIRLDRESGIKSNRIFGKKDNWKKEYKLKNKHQEQHFFELESILNELSFGELNRQDEFLGKTGSYCSVEFTINYNDNKNKKFRHNCNKFELGNFTLIRFLRKIKEINKKGKWKKQKNKT